MKSSRYLRDLIVTTWMQLSALVYEAQLSAQLKLSEIVKPKLSPEPPVAISKKMGTGSMIYLAGPYSHLDPDVRQRRFVAHCAAAAKLMLQGFVVYSPIAHGHPVSEHGQLDQLDQVFWMNQCIPMLSRAEHLVVLTLDGWDESKGTREEITHAHSIGLGVTFWNGAGVVEL